MTLIDTMSCDTGEHFQRTSSISIVDDDQDFRLNHTLRLESYQSCGAIVSLLLLLFYFFPVTALRDIKWRTLFFLQI